MSCLVPVYLAEDGKSLHRKMDVSLTKVRNFQILVRL